MKNKLLLLIAISSLAFVGCIRINYVEGNYQIVSQKRHLQSPFSKVEMQGSFDLEIRDNKSDTIIVQAESNLIDNILTEVNNGVLIIKTPFHRNIKPNEPIIIWCKMSAIESVRMEGSGSIDCDDLTNNNTSIIISGSGDIHATKITSASANCMIEGSGDIQIDSIKSGDTKFTIDGSGDINAHVSCNNFKSVFEGSGKIKIKGNSQLADIAIHSSGSFDGYSFYVSSCHAFIGGSGDIRISVSDSLNATINGSGSVIFNGNPLVVSKVSGSGSVTKNN